MEQIKELVDKRLKSWCIQCGAWIGDIQTSSDHIPSKSLLRKPFPANLPTIKICKSCNNSFAPDEEYLFLFLNCVLSGSTDPNRHTDIKAKRALLHGEKLRARIESSKTEYQAIEGNIRCVWNPETERVNRVIIKNARGHVFYELAESMLNAPDHVSITPLQTMTVAKRAEFNNVQPYGAYPEVGSRMMTRIVEGQDLSDGWIVVQNGVYRYSVEQHGGILVRSVMFEYLATEVFWSDL